jgi:hypothetical protein
MNLRVMRINERHGLQFSPSGREERREKMHAMSLIKSRRVNKMVSERRAAVGFKWPPGGVSRGPGDTPPRARGNGIKAVSQRPG